MRVRVRLSLDQVVRRHDVRPLHPNLYWLLDTSDPKTGREKSFYHTTTTSNSWQAYASFLNSRQFYGDRDRNNLPFFALDFMLKRRLLRQSYEFRGGKETSKVASSQLRRFFVQQ